uniref:Uncharacterized protein n=1 Tax=Ananas comosus var. bracteatus TaxID=296719 RepID=A0A6V7P986_ANACO|nr:unnamed protein product [Ananas comosus var. bracteatus]
MPSNSSPPTLSSKALSSKAHLFKISSSPPTPSKLSFSSKLRHGCLTIHDPEMFLRFFQWFNPPVGDQAKVIIIGLLKKSSRMEDELKQVKKKRICLWFFLVLSWILIWVLFCNLMSKEGCKSN